MFLSWYNISRRNTIIVNANHMLPACQTLWAWISEGSSHAHHLRLHAFHVYTSLSCRTLFQRNSMFIMASRIIAVIIALPIFMLSIAVVVQSNQNLTFMFITSYGRFGLNSSGAIPAADIALETINANPNILPGYNLVYEGVRDSEVSHHAVSQNPLWSDCPQDYHRV